MGPGVTLRGRRLPVCLMLASCSAPALAQDAVQGAMLYMRLANDTRSCVSCHGPDPGMNHNNILRAANGPDTLVKVMNTVSAMGFLSSQLTPADRADVTAFLGNVVRMNDAAAPVRVWPATLDFGQVPLGGSSARQFVRITNPSTGATVALASISASNPAIALLHDCPASLAPGAACEVGVTLRPSDSGLLRGAVVLDSPALPQPMVVGLSGYGSSGPVSPLAWLLTSPELQLEGEKGGAPVRRTLTLTNPGVMPAVLALTSITGPNASQFKLEGGCTAGSVLQAGTQCDLTLSFTPSQLAKSHAVLQLRSDQGNPAALRLDGLAAAPPAPVTPVETLASSSGGGCSIGPPHQRGHDPLLWLMALLALAAALVRKRRRNSG